MVPTSVKKMSHSPLKSLYYVLVGVSIGERLDPSISFWRQYYPLKPDKTPWLWSRGEGIFHFPLNFLGISGMTRTTNRVCVG